MAHEENIRDFQPRQYMKKYHDSSWSPSEHALAKEQIDRYGVCFTDDAGRPIDDEEGVLELARTEGLAA